MIIVKLAGGLGNQLFQYAIGYNLAYKNNTGLLLDISAFNSCKLRNYELSVFNIQENFASLSDINKFKPKKILKFYTIKNKKHIKQKGTSFDSKILELKGDLYLDGYWQSEKFFKEVEKQIREDFSFKIASEQLNKQISTKITMDNSISIHVRRGDYITNTKTNSVHGICSLDYYSKSVKYITNKVENSHFLIFSDDINWVKENLDIPFPKTYVDWNNSDKAYEDLRLMSLCKHNIIANSTFSWWGAWLNNNPDKIVIAPRKWFNDSKIDAADIIPESWVKL